MYKDLISSLKGSLLFFMRLAINALGVAMYGKRVNQCMMALDGIYIQGALTRH